MTVVARSMSGARVQCGHLWITGARLRRETAVEEEAASENALACFSVRLGDALFRPHVVELRVLRLELRVVLVETLRLDDRVAKRLEQRDATVLVGIRAILGERVDEVLREMRLVALEGALGRRDDHPIRRGENGNHVAARAREIHERHLLRRETRREAARSRARSGRVREC